jgi:hypothetical protein
MILPVMAWPGLALTEEMAEFKRTGNIVPGGMEMALEALFSLDVSPGVAVCADANGSARKTAHESAPRNQRTAR